MRSSFLLRRRINQVILYAVAVICALIFLFPFVVTLLNGFKTETEIFTSMSALPRRLLLSNFINGWRLAKFGTALRNSLIVTGGTVGLTLIASSFAAYAFSQFEFHGRNFAFFALIASMMIPFQVIIIPLTIILSRLRMINSLLGLIFPQVALGIPFTTFILTGFFREIPVEILDAAKIDGCSRFKILARIVIPLAKPALSAATILQFLWVWNNFLLPLVVVRGKDLQTIPLALQVFSTQHETQWSLQFAMISLAIIPGIAIYIFLHRQFVEGLHMGAIKG